MVAPLINVPLLYHWLPDPAEEVSVTLPPAQNVRGPPALIVGVAGVGFTATVVPADAGDGQPDALVVTTV